MTGKYVLLADGMESELWAIFHQYLPVTCSLARIRLYSTKTLKSLGTLVYHRDHCQAVAFARSLPRTNVRFESGVVADVIEDQKSDSEDDDDEGKMRRCRWLVSGGKDHRVAIWTLMNFENSVRCEP